MIGLVEFGPTVPCDRCGHQLRHHGSADTGSACSFGARSKNPIDRCPCDGWFAPKTERSRSYPVEAS